ncbi:MAG TPA: GIY-YIG nuclease family protein [Pyrinomonadaceae bacterium]|jgi:hypothetical protein|nr:GIY-YIG nuclease family protein [Pyrinomonadaceae bacterium]
MKETNKQLKKDYQQTPRPMGILLIRNNRADKVFLVASVDLPGAINRHKFQLNAGGHPNKTLQADWNQLGADAFAFEIVDELAPRADLKLDYRAELTSLEDLWLEKLQPFGDRGYNLPKLSRAEKLRRISANRLGDA